MADELEKKSAAALLGLKNGFRMTNEQAVTIKEEIIEEEDETDENDDVPRLGPAALGLQRVGTPMTPRPSPTQPTQVLNARGMPARIRKKNKLFFDDDIVNTPHHRVTSSKKVKVTPSKKPKVISTTMKSPNILKSTPKKNNVFKESASTSSTPTPIQTTDKVIGQKIGLRLRNLLKLPKAHKWVCYEWFYSNIDRCLFGGENDFRICLRESFPELVSHSLTRVEWNKVRRMMGKPRRCSMSFFNEERLELEKKRKKIRALQQRKASDMSTFKDLPSEIPSQLVIGTKVTARLRKPQDGLFTGSIDAVDTSNNTYRITFDRLGLGTHSVPDYEVLSNEQPDTMTITTYQSKFRPKNGVSPFISSFRSPICKLKRDPLLSGSMINKPVFVSANEDRIGGFPTKLLERMVLVDKILKIKREKISLLRKLNTEAEKCNSFELEISEEFERKYATVLIDLEKLNHDLQQYLDEMQAFCREIAPEPSVAAMLAPSFLRERCREDALEIVERCNIVIAPDKGPVKNTSILDLITDLTALLLQVKSLGDSDQNAYELQVLEGTMEEIKQKLSPNLQKVFTNSVEVHMKHVQVGLAQGSSNNDLSSSSSYLLSPPNSSIAKL